MSVFLLFVAILEREAQTDSRSTSTRIDNVIRAGPAQMSRLSIRSMTVSTCELLPRAIKLSLVLETNTDMRHLSMMQLHDEDTSCLLSIFWILRRNFQRYLEFDRTVSSTFPLIPYRWISRSLTVFKLSSVAVSSGSFWLQESEASSTLDSSLPKTPLVRLSLDSVTTFRAVVQYRNLEKQQDSSKIWSLS